MPGGRLLHRIELGGGEEGGLLDNHVIAGLQRRD